MALALTASTLTVLEALNTDDTPTLYILKDEKYLQVIDLDSDDLETASIISVIVKGGRYYPMHKDRHPFYVKAVRPCR